MPRISGHILTDEGFVEGSISFDKNEILDISTQRHANPLAKGVVLPLFVNPHTHIGDSFINADLTGTVEEIVAPPDGLKHRLLAEATDDEVVDGMRKTLKLMTLSGVSHFIDFREGGVKGASLLYNASIDYPVHPLVYGRPSGMEYDRKEMESLLKVVDGVGLSSISDWEPSLVEKMRKHVRSSGRGFAFHASESVREDIDAILDLEPDFLIHMIEASGSDLERCAQAHIPIVICPRSNAHYGKAPDFEVMMSSGVDLMLGTDNAMLSSPSLFDEMRFVRQMPKLNHGLSSGSILSMALNSRKLLKGQPIVSLDIGQPSNFLVLEWRGENPEKFIVERASEKDISVVARERRLWTRRNGGLKEESDWQRRE